MKFTLKHVFLDGDLSLWLQDLADLFERESCSLHPVDPSLIDVTLKSSAFGPGYFNRDGDVVFDLIKSDVLGQDEQLISTVAIEAWVVV